MYTPMRIRDNKVMLSDAEIALLKPLMDNTGLNRTAAIVFLIRKYAKFEAETNKPK